MHLRRNPSFSRKKFESNHMCHLGHRAADYDVVPIVCSITSAARHLHKVNQINVLYISYFFVYIYNMMGPPVRRPKRLRTAAKPVVHSPQELMSMCKAFKSVQEGKVEIGQVFKLYGWSMPQHTGSADEHVWDLVKTFKDKIDEYTKDLIEESELAYNITLGLQPTELWQTLRSKYSDIVPNNLDMDTNSLFNNENVYVDDNILDIGDIDMDDDDNLDKDNVNVEALLAQLGFDMSENNAVNNAVTLSESNAVTLRY